MENLGFLNLDAFVDFLTKGIETYFGFGLVIVLLLVIFGGGGSGGGNNNGGGPGGR